MHIHARIRIGSLAVAVAAALLAAGCSGGTSAPGTSAKTRTPAAMNAAEVIRSVSNQAKQANSATVVMNIRSTGGFSMQGTMKIRTRPVFAAAMHMSELSSNGQTISGGIKEIINGNAVYLKFPALSQQSGKPWVRISMAQLNGATGNTFGNLSQQMRQQDPLSAARMLGASKDVRAVGKGTVDGVATTHYHGTFSYNKALSLLTPGLRKMMRQTASSANTGSITFDAWVDGENHVRLVTESYDSGMMGHVTSSVRFVSIGQPVNIKPPPASEVASLPGVG